MQYYNFVFYNIYVL